MPEARDWRAMRDQGARLVEERSGESAEVWMARIDAEGPADAEGLKAWPTDRGLAGYAREHLIRERFGYPHYLVDSAETLIDAQYADRPALRPIYEAVITAALGVGEVELQARKGYVALVAPRRTFARVKATTRTRVDLALRLHEPPGGRRVPSRVHEDSPVQISLTDVGQMDAEVCEWLARAYRANA